MVYQEEIRMTCQRDNPHQKAIATPMAFSFICPRLFAALLLMLFVSGCNQTDIKEPLIYDGPVQIGENVELHYTEDNIVKLKMIAELVHEFENGDREFPKGLYLEFY